MKPSTAVKKSRTAKFPTQKTGEIDYGGLPNLLGYLLRQSQILVFQHFANNLGEMEITPGQHGLLVLISCNPGISQTALAKAVGVERSTLGEVIMYLEKRALVERRPFPQDRRSNALYLSLAGQSFLAKSIAVVEAQDQDLTQHFSHQERQTLINLLRKLLDRP